MLRTALPGLVCALLLCGSSLADDTTAKALDEAKAKFDKASKDSKAELLADLKKAEAKMQDAGNLKGVEKVQAEIKAFEEQGTSPKSVPTKGYDGKVKDARSTLEKAYEGAVKKYTQDSRQDKTALDKAKAIQKELDDFRKGVVSRPADAAKCGDKYYKVFDDVLNWEAAKKKCDQLGGHLALIETKEDNAFVVDLVKKSKVVEVWLGATDEKKEGEWVWVTGKKMTYTNWAKNQPNNKGAGEHYLVLVLAQDGQWSDQPNTSVQHKPGFVCQWDK